MRIAPSIRAAVPALTLLATVIASSPARGDEKRECLASYERAQQLRRDGKLRAAREQLAVCSRQECPAIVRGDCTQWLGEVMQAMPSVVVAARDAQGHDLLDVRVTVDGALVSEHLDGKPLPLDPGPHKVRYETSGAPAVEEQVLVREGERNRPLTVTFKTADAAGDTDKTSAEKDRAGADKDKGAEAAKEPRGAPVLAYTLIGVGVVALGAALYFDLKATGDANQLAAPKDAGGCKPDCSQQQVDDVRTKYIAAGVLLGVGVAAAGTGALLLLLRPSDDNAKTQASGWRFDVAPALGGAAASIRARF